MLDFLVWFKNLTKVLYEFDKFISNVTLVPERELEHAWLYLFDSKKKSIWKTNIQKS